MFKLPPLNNHLSLRDDPIQVGETAPDFTLRDQHCKKWNLSDAVKGGGVVLCFFPMAFTPVCESEMKCITAELNRWENQNVRMVGISCNTFATLEAWSRVLGLQHTLLADMHRQVSKAYGLYWPEMNLCSRGTLIVGGDPSGKGKIRFAQIRLIKEAMDIEEILTTVGRDD